MKKSPTEVGRYLDFRTDFAFKKIFGTEGNKKLLIHFLNCLLDLKKETRILDITYLNTEIQSKKKEERKAIFDVYCETNQGERFIVEMQKNSQKHFKDRILFYSTFPIQELSERTKEWDFQLSKIYVIGVLNFTFNTKYPNKVITKVQMKDEYGEVFNEHLNFVYLEIPKFRKSINELETFMDKWLFLIKNLHRLEDRPVEVQNEIFDKLFSTAEICNLNDVDFMDYSRSLKDYRDWHNTLNHAIEKKTAKILKEGLAKGKKMGLKKGLEKGMKEGMKEGIEKGRTETQNEIVKKMLKKGYNEDTIAELTNLTLEEISKIKISL